VLTCSSVRESSKTPHATLPIRVAFQPNDLTIF
jgi:hypothetical protein